jgi:hypothetical protein
MSKRIHDRGRHPRWTVLNWANGWHVERPGRTSEVSGEFPPFDAFEEAIAFAHEQAVKDREEVLQGGVSQDPDAR